MNVDLGALTPIAARKAREAEELRCAAAGLWAKAEALPHARDLRAALTGGTVIAEMKRRSPSGGELRSALDPAAVARGYAHAGAAAISVLTDAVDFGGSLDDLDAVHGAVQIPVLRKDFVVDPVQIAEARVAGADWVLLIVALLDGALLDACLDAVRRAHGHAIVEVHDEAELARALDSDVECIGINNRDLRTLRTDLSTFGRLRSLVPDSIVCISESGIREPADAARLVLEGADAVLLGEVLMRAADPVAACAAMVVAAREAAA
ncbi:MAG: indole-3-glycerol-phosphate synthase [Candidatus Dormibacteraeota bacterium]|nr:indole-3-glycerol-phosphate synthase [Candidatus Dormibacteraeota bacterium]